MAERAPPPTYDEAVNNKVPPQRPVTVVVEQGFAPFPQRMTCPSCHCPIETRVEYRPNSNTHLIALLLCFLFWPCALYPYCIDTCKDALHYCPECGTFLGTYTN
ncbi:lipopolysaccharide-induced tumor necrosis factor-alpha factor homolog isoform X2 [Lycorma delicatula]